MSLTECTPVTKPIGGALSLSDGIFYMSVAKFSCDPGYTIEGHHELQCKEDGQWSFDMPQCLKIGRNKTFICIGSGKL